MKPIEEEAKELEKEGWQILWTSEVEAIAIGGDAKKGHCKASRYSWN